MSLSLRGGRGLSCVAVMALAGATVAGPLVPPVGIVTPTYKTLTEVEPRMAINAVNTPGDNDATPSTFRITQPGSYYLTGNITGQSGRIGIEVLANNVTIDLNGFTMSGGAGSWSAIDASNNGLGNFFAVTVKNGFIRDWGRYGVRLGGSTNAVGRHLVENVEVSGITSGGVALGVGIGVSAGSTILNCRISACAIDGIQGSQGIIIENTQSNSNTSHGINVNENSIIRGCSTIGNGNDGITVAEGTLVENCTSQINGLAGIRIQNSSGIVVNCRADQNGTQGPSGGIVVGPGSVVKSSSANSNGGSGIIAGSTSTIVDCSARANTQNGIVVSSGTVRGCTARENTLDGISVSSGSLVEGCSAAANVDDGIQAGSGCRVVGNTASANGDDGIAIGADGYVRANNCDGNGTTTADGAGVHVVTGVLGSNSDTRVEENNCTDNDRGIWVEDPGNIIFRNTCSGNTTNYLLDALSISGTIVNLVGGGTITTSNSFANFEF